MNAGVRVLLVEDNVVDAELLVREMQRGQLGVDALRVDTKETLEDALQAFRPDIVLSDYSLPGFGGIDALAIVREQSPGTPFIFVSGTIGEERAIEALKRGAVDYVLKENRARLVPAMRRALQEATERSARQTAELNLEASEKRFQLFMHHLPSATMMTNAEGLFTYVNPGAVLMIGKSVDEIIGHSIHEVFPSAYADTFVSKVKTAIETRAVDSTLEEMPTATGLRHFHTCRFPVFDHQGEVVLVGTIATDMTENLAQQHKIARLSRIHAFLSAINATIIRVRYRQELFREVCRVAVTEGGFRMAGIGILDPDGHKLVPVAWNGFKRASVKELLSVANVAEDPGIASHAIRRQRAFVVSDIERSPHTPAKPNAQKHDYRSIVTLPLMMKRQAIGVVIFCATEAAFFDQEELELLNGLMEDISYALDYISKEQTLSYVSQFDSLTGLSNREVFYEQLTRAMKPADEKPSPMAVMAIDLQQFGSINHTFGRSAGDQFLKMFANRLRSMFSGPAAAVSRISGDRFAVAIIDEQATSLGRLLETSVIQPLSTPVIVDGMEIHITIKIGIAMFPNDGAEADIIMRNAEAALQRAKDTVEGYAFYSPEMSARVAARLRLAGQLRKALDARQFFLCYQPKVDLRTRQMLGLEALIRWRHPTQGIVSPSEFIPLLEESGMIVAVGRWVIEQVVADIRNWRERGLNVPPVAVNVSQRQVRQKDFVASVTSAVDGTGGIDLEITESLIMEDTEASVDKLRQLRAAGLRIFMDDFGTGYSSLSQLVQLPLDAFKIDRAFIATMSEMPETRLIIETMISLAHAVGIDVVAEGVETEEQAEILLSLGCDQAQGYLFSWPITATEIEKQLSKV